VNRRLAEDWANRVYGLWLAEAIAAGDIRIAPPPTRAETIKHVWGKTRDFWLESSVEGKLTIQCDPTEECMTFELIRYGGTFVVECEGVVVERMPVIG
jgi:hypothetical protein